MSNIRWNSCHGCWHFLIEIIVGIIYMGVSFLGSSWSMFLAMVGNFPRGVLSGVSCCISYWGNKGVRVWYKFYAFLRFDKFQGKTFGEFYYGNCLTQLTIHDSLHVLRTILRVSLGALNRDMAVSSQQDLIYVSRPNANHINFDD